MDSPRSRFSRRHLLALCTFLVPLGVLALLGQSELQRRGTEVEAAIEREALQFLRSAAAAVDQQIDREVARIGEAVQRLLAEQGPVRTPLALRESTPALLDIVLLDEQSALVWPSPPPPTASLPLGRDARPRSNDTSVAAALGAVDLLLTRGEVAAAEPILVDLLRKFEAANPPGRSGRRDPDDGELVARFRLATIHRKLGRTAEARHEFEQVRATVIGNPRRLNYETAALGLMAEAAVALGGTTGERIAMLRAIAESNRDGYAADGLLTALAQRLAESIAADDPAYADSRNLLREAYQRAQSRAFAGQYELLLKESLRQRLLRLSAEGGLEDTPVSLVATLGSAAVLLWARAATEAERSELRCARVALRIDLEQLLAPVLQPYLAGDASFTLAVQDRDPEGVPMVPAPTEVPADFSPPVIEVRGLVLRAFPANTLQRLAETEAAARTRTYLLIALFVTALGGALWSWRSVSREAELAALKVDLVSRVSHELKTPLALIRMYGETLDMGRARDADQAARFGGIIARESERLTTLIQRILDFSRQQAGTLVYEPRPIDIGELLRTVVEAYTPHLEQRGAILIDSLPLGIRVECDANACESAVLNLLENAAKYGPEGDGDHEIDLELTKDQTMAHIEVRDRGRGIPDAELERVFDGFYRASNAGEVRGAGLGLSLVRHFARAHGGDVTAAARPDGGTVFRLSLPLTTRRIADPGTAPSLDTAGPLAPHSHAERP